MSFFAALCATIRAAKKASARVRPVHSQIGKLGLSGRPAGMTKAPIGVIPPGVVVILTAVLAVEFAAGVTLAGETEQKDPTGAPEQVSETGEAKELMDVTVTEKAAVPPAVTVPCEGVSVSEKPGCPGTIPLPVSVTR